MTSSVDIMARRRLIFRYWSQELSSKNIHGLLHTAGYEVSIETVRRDIRTMGKWLPEIVTLEGDVEKVTIEMLAKMKIGQARLAQLAFAADNSNAMVGAAKGLIDGVATEADFRFKAGQLKMAPIDLKLTQEVRMLDVSKEDLVSVVAPVVRELMEREARGADSARPEEDTEKPVD